jgi:hypothetical protein
LVPTTSIFSDRTGNWYQDPGWKDCASARYIHTELSAATMKNFRPGTPRCWSTGRTTVSRSNHFMFPSFRWSSSIRPSALVQPVRASRRSILGRPRQRPKIHCPKNYNR